MTLVETQTSKSTGEIPGNSSMASVAKKAGSESWALRWYVLAFCFAPAFVLSFCSVFLESEPLLIVSQWLLGVSTYISLRMLSRTPLINPVQTVVFTFHFWFAVGPAVICSLKLAIGDYETAAPYLNASALTLAVVYTGLPIYATISNAVTRYWPRQFYAHFLRPSKVLYRPATLAVYSLIALTVWLIITVLGAMGLQAFRTVNYLGGVVSESWWLSALAQSGNISRFATVGIIAYLCGPKIKGRAGFKLIAIAVILVNIAVSASSGWKTAIMLPFFWVFVVYATWHDKIPWLFLALSATLYIFVVEPVIYEMRFRAEVSSAKTQEDRLDAFQALDLVTLYSRRDWKQFNIESPFRGVFFCADQVTLRSDLTSGPWEGRSIVEGLLALVPRIIYPDKPDLNVGNFFAYELGLADERNAMHNISISMPFEFVGNFGILAGVGAFVLIGFCWSSFCCLILSPSGMEKHPLNPIFVFMAFQSFEAGVGQFVAQIRDLPITLACAFLAWQLLGRKL